MLTVEPLTPVLAAKQIALTYDDGPGLTEQPLPAPGPRSADLAKYLHSIGVQATFFVIGEQAQRHLDVLDSYAKLGHLVANHTFTHPGASHWRSTSVDHRAEISRTHRVIKDYVTGRFIFRSPGGTPWPTPELVVTLNADPDCSRYSRIDWTIDSDDWKFWEAAKSAQTFADHVLGKIEDAGRGVVLLHDCSTAAEPHLRRTNRALESAQMFVPKLLRRGYAITRLDKLLTPSP